LFHVDFDLGTSGFCGVWEPKRLLSDAAISGFLVLEIVFAPFSVGFVEGDGDGDDDGCVGKNFEFVDLSLGIPPENNPPRPCGAAAVLELRVDEPFDGPDGDEPFDGGALLSANEGRKRID